MRLLVAAVGRLKPDAERALVERYADRAAKAGAGLGLSLAIREVPESRAARAPDRQREEAAAIRGVVPAGAVILALDEGGDLVTSDAFARRIARLRDDGAADLAFIIGGADGLDRDLVRSAQQVIAFGAMTWPHQLVRAMLAEQIYRAVTILSGHPYHRA
ncbi:MAG: 23S rRNA (pseudouridine(1915)-N(3))-methyltransferase RlmH [Bauldia sp.]|nr:23S rRNA (pseudouridine(1915)-N(3))-methyltransferase RlmH [Bauldia sp.]